MPTTKHTTRFIIAAAATAAVALAGSATAGTTTYKYDVLGRVTEVHYSDGSWVAYTYDATGNRTQVIHHLVP